MNCRPSFRKQGSGQKCTTPFRCTFRSVLRFLAIPAGAFPESERAAKETLALPIHPEIYGRAGQVRSRVYPSLCGHGSNRAGNLGNCWSLGAEEQFLIGVIPKSDQVGVVEEFFELFKTPWEIYVPGRAYDVVVATAREIPRVDARLFLVYGPEPRQIDASIGLRIGQQKTGGLLRMPGSRLPVYGGLATFGAGDAGTSCVMATSGVAGLQVTNGDSTVIRLGYDLFDEIHCLLSAGQPPEFAHIPTIEIHIEMLRRWIVNAGTVLLEIPPCPAGYRFAACLTHDIDFVGIRRHLFDHSMWGFVYRATVGSVRRFARRRLSLGCLLKNWLAAASLPLVYAGWRKDFWEPFEWYLQVEKGLPATYFLIPFKRRSGDYVTGKGAARRAAPYEVTDIPEWTTELRKHGCEMGVHGIDAWHSAVKGREELARIAAVADKSKIGIRMHWLLQNANTSATLERAGYVYDSSIGYNETIGYRAGTSQVFRPLGATTLLELPLHIQDGALFYPQRLNLTEPEAEQRCSSLIANSWKFGGVLTLLWHDRSHGPERFWGGFYIKLMDALKSSEVWFGTAGEVVDWFGKRRAVRFVRIEPECSTQTRILYEGEEIQPPLRIRIHGQAPQCDRTSPSGPTDIPWDGQENRTSLLHHSTLCSFS